jgi:DNA-binding helix-hairpin-helix protein with protein kinase domain
MLVLTAIKPTSWPYFIASGVIALASLYTSEVSLPILQNARSKAQGSLDAAMAEWREKLSLQKIADDYKSLRAENDAYLKLKSDHEQRLRAIMLSRNELELKNYLDRFEISKEKDAIKGLGPAKIAALMSYGIETFADVTPEACQAAPGVGYHISQALLAHRALLEGQFKPTGTPSPLEIQERMLLDIETGSKAKAMEGKILSLSAHLQKQVSATRGFAAKPYKPLVKALKRLADIDAGTSFLSASPRITTVQTSSSSAGSSSHASTAVCPKCASEMVVTRRNGSNLIWGCRKYPYCTATRPYT